jgi:hypothetical protein
MSSGRVENLLLAAPLITGIPGCEIPDFTDLPPSTFSSLALFPQDENTKEDVQYDRPGTAAIEHYYQEVITSSGVSSAVKAAVEPMLEQYSVMTRCSPLAEARHGDVSFAGTYPSFIPKPFPQTIDAVCRGVGAVLAGQHTDYAQYYQNRHMIPMEDRGLGVLLMRLVQNPAIHGTGYAFQSNVRAEYVFDPSLDQEQYAIQRNVNHLTNDKFGRSNEDPNGFCNDIDFDVRVTKLLTTLENHFSMPVDVEFLVDSEGSINVVQIRKMSKKHRDNWSNYYRQSHHDIDTSAPRRAIINSVGLLPDNKEITTIQHEDTFTTLTSLSASQDAVQLLIVHNDDRTRDHLQYAVLEDPYVQAAFHASPKEGDFVTNTRKTVYSNGDTYSS